MTSELPEHLGGQMAGNVDTGLVKALRDAFGVRTLVDIGCGDGIATVAYEGLGLDVMGVDGDWVRLPGDPRFVLHDFTRGPMVWRGTFDLAYSVEFLEHLEEQYLPNVMPLFAACSYAVVTAAKPGQEGHHHVNCQPPEYWHEVFGAWGLQYDHETTAWLQGQSTMQKATGPRKGRRMKFFQRNGLFFRRV